MADYKKDPNDPNSRPDSNSRFLKIVGWIVALIVAAFLIYFFAVPRTHTTTNTVVTPAVVTPAQTVPQNQTTVPAQSITPVTPVQQVPSNNTNTTAPATTNP